MCTPIPPRLIAAFAAAAVLCSFTSRVQADDSLIFEETFNDLDRIELLNGAILGANGSGVSGHLDDKAWASAAADLAPAGEGPVAKVRVKPARPVENLDEFTVTAWYKPRVPMQQDSTLFSAFATRLLWEEKTKRWVWRVDTTSDTETRMMHWFFSNSRPEWATPGEWVFIAMTWTRQGGGKGQFYHGGPKEEATPDRGMTRNEPVHPLSEREHATSVIGGDPTHGDRAFDGSIDDVRFFARALNAEEIESIREADLRNRPLPQR